MPILHHHQPRPSSSKECVDNDDITREIEDLVPSKPSKEEKAFLRRMDWILITYVWLSYCLKSIDTSNYKTAYVSGMKEELSMYGNELNYFDTIYRIGYAMSVIPSSILLATYRPSILLPSLDLVWGIMTAVIASARSPTLIYVARFIIGVCGASSYPGIITILMNWYTPAELSTRFSIFGTSYPVSNILVGSLQAALYKGLNGKGGISGWRYLFIINGAMTVAVAFAGYAIIPDSPLDSRSWWVGVQGRQIARERMKRVGKVVGKSVGATGTLREWRLRMKGMVRQWQMWAFCAAYVFWSFSQNANYWYVLYLKAAVLPGGGKMSVEMVNLVPIPTYVLHSAAMVFFAWLSDRSRPVRRFRFIIVQMVLHLAACITLSVWPSGFVGQMVAFQMLFLSNGAGPIILAWLADMVKEKPEERSLAVAVSVTVIYAVDCWANLLLWPVTKAPRYVAGYQTAAAFSVVCIGISCWIRWKVGGARKLKPVE